LKPLSRHLFREGDLDHFNRGIQHPYKRVNKNADKYEKKEEFE